MATTLGAYAVSTSAAVVGVTVTPAEVVTVGASPVRMSAATPGVTATGALTVGA